MHRTRLLYVLLFVLFFTVLLFALCLPWEEDRNLVCSTFQEIGERMKSVQLDPMSLVFSHKLLLILFIDLICIKPTDTLKKHKTIAKKKVKHMRNKRQGSNKVSVAKTWGEIC